MTDHDQLIRIARQIARESGRDYDAPKAKRAHWRKRAARVLEVNPSPSAYARVKDALANIMVGRW